MIRFQTFSSPSTRRRRSSRFPDNLPNPFKAPAPPCRWLPRFQHFIFHTVQLKLSIFNAIGMPADNSAENGLIFMVSSRLAAKHHIFQLCRCPTNRYDDAAVVCHFSSGPVAVFKSKARFNPVGVLPKAFCYP